QRRLVGGVDPDGAHLDAGERGLADEALVRVEQEDPADVVVFFHTSARDHGVGEGGKAGYERTLPIRSRPDPGVVCSPKSRTSSASVTSRWTGMHPSYATRSPALAAGGFHAAGRFTAIADQPVSALSRPVHRPSHAPAGGPLSVRRARPPRVRSRA